jgi:hypothetical protein
VAARATIDAAVAAHRASVGDLGAIVNQDALGAKRERARAA